MSKCCWSDYRKQGQNKECFNYNVKTLMIKNKLAGGEEESKADRAHTQMIYIKL